MQKRHFGVSMLPVYVLVLGCFLFAGIGGSRAITTLAERAPVTDRKCVIIDAGHGGIDSGTVAPDGEYESTINLQIALRLEGVLQLLGVDTVMIRTTDTSIHTQGNTIAAQKVSDLKMRVKIVNQTDNAILISIHQNYYSDSRYSGAQVFYSPFGESQALAKELQAELVNSLNPGSNRECKQGDGIYLLQNIKKTGVIIECGFLSNYEESAKLQDGKYQQKLSAVIASVCSRYLHGN